MKAAAREASGKAATVRAGIMAGYAMRIEAAYRSGLTREQITEIVRGLKQEMQAALRAAGEAAATERAGRMDAIVTDHHRQGRPPSRQKPRAAEL